MESKQTENYVRTIFTQSPTRLRLSFSKHCEAKIRVACSLWPNNEWSGAAFYRYTCVDKDGKPSINPDNISIEVVDFCLQDIGNAVYTEYDINADTASYIADHIDTLMGCKMMLLHSHNKMAAFFSGTDMSTFHEQARQCTNILSVVVNNAGQYVAKFSQSYHVNRYITTTVDGADRQHFNLVGDKDIARILPVHSSEKSEDEFVEVKIWDCDITVPQIPADYPELDALRAELQAAGEAISKRKVEESAKRKEELTEPVNGFDRHLPDNGLLDGYGMQHYTDNEIAIIAGSIEYLSFDSFAGSMYEGFYMPIELVQEEDFLKSYIHTWYLFWTPDVSEVQKTALYFAKHRQEYRNKDNIDIIINQLNELAESLKEADKRGNR